MMGNLRWVPKLLRCIYLAGLTWKDQNLGRKFKVRYMNEPCNAMIQQRRVARDRCKTLLLMLMYKVTSFGLN